MKMTRWARDRLTYRKQQRRLTAEGWDFVSEPVWQINRGGRYRERIVAVEISTDGKSLYVKTAAETMTAPAQPTPSTGR